MKKCSKCKIEKPVIDFSKNSTSKDGLRPDCKTCRAIESRIYYQKNIAERRAKNKEYTANNKEKIKAYQVSYREKNPEKVKESVKKSYLKNKEKILEYSRQWREKNREKWREYSKKSRDKNPDLALSSNRKRRAAKHGADGRHSKNDIANLFKRQRGLCAYCKIKLKESGPDKMHIDHIQPLSRGGSDWPHNLQLLCRKCNLTKHATDPFVFAQRRGMLV